MPQAEAKLTLEQQRAADAWQRSKGISKDKANFAKGLPALIMNSGLMQVLAFCHDKGEYQEEVAKQLREWLAKRFPDKLPSSDFARFMDSLLAVSSRDYQQITQEALAWLRWLRLMAAARLEAKGDAGGSGS